MDLLLQYGDVPWFFCMFTRDYQRVVSNSIQLLSSAEPAADQGIELRVPQRVVRGLQQQMLGNGGPNLRVLARRLARQFDGVRTGKNRFVAAVLSS